MDIGSATGSYIGTLFYELSGSYRNSMIFATLCYDAYAVVALTLPKDITIINKKTAETPVTPGK